MIFAWFQASTDPSLVGQILDRGLNGVLLVAVIVLWRANQQLSKSNETLLREMLSHVEMLKDIPGALERLQHAIVDSNRR